MPKLSDRSRLHTTRNIIGLIRTTKNERVADVYWKQFIAMSKRFNRENPEE